MNLTLQLPCSVEGTLRTKARLFFTPCLLITQSCWEQSLVTGCEDRQRGWLGGHLQTCCPHLTPSPFWANGILIYLLPWETAPWVPLSPGCQLHYLRANDVSCAFFFLLNINIGFVFLYILILRPSFLHCVLRYMSNLRDKSS